MKPIKWQTREDGVIYFEHKVLTESYFIYPPKYDDEDQLNYILNIIDNHGHVSYEFQSLDLNEVKSKAHAHLEKIVQVFIDLFCCKEKLH